MRTSIAALLAVALCACDGDDPNPAPATHYLAVITVASSRGEGTVTGPGGLDCHVAGTVTSGTCALDYADGTSVTLIATSAGETEFDTWGGDCSGHGDCTMDMSADRTVTARFVHAFTVAIVPAESATGSGVITSNPVGIDCTLTGTIATGTCSRAFPDETAIIVSAAPATGSIFVGWTGAGTCGSDPVCVVPLDRSHSIVASFSPAPSD